MADLTFYDAAFPTADPPVTDGFCLYIGGDATHVWTAADITTQKARYRLPIYVRSNPEGADAAADAAEALRQLAAIGAPGGILVCWDLETAADREYIAGVHAAITAAGDELIVYGSQSTVMGNDAPGGLYFGADWTGTPHIAAGDAMTQYRNLAAYDEDLAEATLPFWDTGTKPPPAPAPAPAPVPADWQEIVMNRLPVVQLGDQDHPDQVQWVSRVQGLCSATRIEGAATAMDGSFGNATKAAVEAVQRAKKIAVDGSVGPVTWSVLVSGSTP